MKRYTRRMTFNERAFVVADQICPPVANQLFFDGEGVLDAGRWRAAVAAASEANPGTRIVLDGYLGWSRWVDSGIPPRVREVDGSTWDGHGPEGAPYLQEALPVREGPVCEVILIQGPTPRVVFRSHHGALDARGTLFWAEDIFRALRGEALVGSSSTMTDIQMCRSFQHKLRIPYPTEHIAPTGLVEGQAHGVVWKRRTVKGKVPQLLARCARLSAEEAWRHADGIVRFGIPVDMRAHQPGLRSTANLSFALYIEVKRETTPEQIADDIAFQVKHGYEGMLTRGDTIIEHLPLWLLRAMGRRVIQKRQQSGLYSLSGTLSNLGRVDLERYQGGGFTATAYWAIPPGNEYYPFFLVMSGYAGGSELMLSMPKVLAGGGRLESALEHIAQSLEQSVKEDIGT